MVYAVWSQEEEILVIILDSNLTEKVKNMLLDLEFLLNIVK